HSKLPTVIIAYMVRLTSRAERVRQMRIAWGMKDEVVRLAATRPIASNQEAWAGISGSGRGGFLLFGLGIELAVGALALHQLLDAVAAHGVIHRGPGAARPFDLGGVVVVERAIPFLGAAGRGLVEMRVAIGASHHPVAGLAALLLDAEPGIGVIDRFPGTFLPGGFRGGVFGERADPLFLAALGQALELGVLVDAAHDPEAFHDDLVSPFSRLL